MKMFMKTAKVSPNVHLPKLYIRNRTLAIWTTTNKQKFPKIEWSQNSVLRKQLKRRVVTSQARESRDVTTVNVAWLY